MAIIVEEQSGGRSASIVKLGIWLVLLGVIGAGIYYLFFKQQQLVEYAVPANFQNVAQIAKIEFNPDEVINDPLFLSLKQYIRLEPPAAIGKANPFLGF